MAGASPAGRLSDVLSLMVTPPICRTAAAVSAWLSMSPIASYMGLLKLPAVPVGCAEASVPTLDIAELSKLVPDTLLKLKS